MSTEIYYFSGTGNSLHVAKELQKRLPETTLIPLVSLLSKNAVKTAADTVGFVFPIHMTTVPPIIKDIIRKLDIKSANYIFAVATRVGTPCNTAFSKIEKILQQKGKSLDAQLILNMASNDPKFKGWRAAAQEEIAELETVNQERLNSFAKTIMNREKYRDPDTHVTLPVNFVIEHLGAFLADYSGDGGKSFYADAKCSGCGTCEKVCLSRKIKMTDQKPVWQKSPSCFLCYACINFCPAQSIQIRSGRFFKFYTDQQGRYFHPDATTEDIAGQK